MPENLINKFTIRVYAIIVNEKNEVLLSDEFQFGMKMTKFPGGGMEFGEGTIDCLKREAIEEFGQEIEVLNHLYTTDFFQQAKFKKEYQVVSIYYLAKFKDKIKFKVSEKSFDFNKPKNESQSFRWQAIKNLEVEDMTLPIDKKVAEIIINKNIQIEI
ncbi:MAG: NUDIX domain-containing protein [Bacteroidota bacterium]